jgi:hypothetical protein
MTLPLKASINNYGSGVLIDEVALVNPESELSAKDLNNLRNDTAAMTATAPILLFQFDGYAGTPIAIASSATWISGWDSTWGNNHTYVPVITRTSIGLLSVQLSASVPDFIGNTNLVNIRNAEACLVSGTTPGSFICNVTSASTFTIRMYNLSGTLTDNVGNLVFVKVF